MVFPLTRIWLWASDSSLAQFCVWLCVLLASIEQHLFPGRFRTSPCGSVPQSRRSGPQHELTDAQTSWDQPSRRHRLPGKKRKRERKEGKMENQSQVKDESDWGRCCEALVTMVIHLKAIFFSRWVSIFSVERPSVWECSSTGEARRGEEQGGGRRWEASWDCGVVRSKDSWEGKMMKK